MKPAHQRARVHRGTQTLRWSVLSAIDEGLKARITFTAKTGEITDAGVDHATRLASVGLFLKIAKFEHQLARYQTDHGRAPARCVESLPYSHTAKPVVCGKGPIFAQATAQPRLPHLDPTQIRQPEAAPARPVTLSSSFEQYVGFPKSPAQDGLS